MLWCSMGALWPEGAGEEKDRVDSASCRLLMKRHSCFSCRHRGREGQEG